MLPTYAFFWGVRQVRVRHRQENTRDHASVRSPRTRDEVYTLTKYDNTLLKYAAINLSKSAV